MVNEQRRVFLEGLPEILKGGIAEGSPLDDTVKDYMRAVKVGVLEAFERAVPKAPPAVTVQRVDEGGVTTYEVVDRTKPKGERVVGSYRTEQEARAQQRVRQGIRGGAYVLAAVDTDELFHDTDYEVLGNQQTYGVLTGCVLTEDASNMTVDLGAGAILHSGSIVNVTAATDTQTLVADGSNERWAAICLSSAGASVLVSGDPAASSSVEPAKPEIGDRVLLKMYKIQAAQTIANNCEYKLDKRILIRFPVRIRKATDEAVVNNSTTLADEDEFIINVVSGDTLHVRFRLYIANVNTAGGKYALTFPTASTAVGGAITHGLTAVHVATRTAPAALTSGTAFHTLTGGTLIYYTEIDAYFVFTAAGTIRLQAAQETANASDFTIEAGSIMELQWVA